MINGAFLALSSGGDAVLGQSETFDVLEGFPVGIRLVVIVITIVVVVIIRRRAAASTLVIVPSLLRLLRLLLGPQLPAVLPLGLLNLARLPLLAFSDPFADGGVDRGVYHRLVEVNNEG